MAEPVRSGTPGDSTADRSAQQQPVVVKKYANRRLYNTEASSYVTLDHLARMVKEGREFVVYDAKTGEDITRQVLTQIIVEEEGKGGNLLPIGFLRQLISFYDDSLQSLVPRYLEHSMGLFARQQEQMRKAMQQTMEGLFPFSMEEMGKQNVAMMERAFSLFTPFYRGAGAPPGGGTSTPGEPDTDLRELERLKAELTALKSELAALRGRKE
ncbi:polyhydroxyalkanoate synthesis repressor PhaR [Elioraea sp.]|uniref:polyhydroxyalkanoate synthesis repressor PhaR n=1 Tax=Elioraea sp. TaxID=2185103 RepID=UPI003F718301